MTEPVRLAQIGLGQKWGWELGTAIQRTPGVVLQTCYARTPATREAFANQFGCRPAPTLEAAIADPGIEAAVVAAPAHVHAEITRACVQYGRHVLVEKPLALTLRAALEMRTTCNEAGLILAVNHEMRRLGATRAIKSVLEDGLLGQVVAAGADLTLPGKFFPDNWRCHRDTNRGGALMQLGIHHVDTLLYLLGPVVQVEGLFAHTSAPVDIDDVGVAVLTFENGTVATVTASYVSPKSYELRLYGVRANLTCSADMRIWPDSAQVDGRTRLEIQTGELLEAIPINPQDCLGRVLEEFAACIREGGSPETGADEGLAALAVVEAALLSFGTGSPVNPQALYQT